MAEPQSDSQDDRLKQRDWYQPYFIASALILILIFGSLFRLIDINRGLWLDELHTSWTVSGELSDVAGRAESGNQAPVYFYVVKSVVAVLGQSELSLRLVSVVSSIGLSLAAFFVMAFLFRSSLAGLLAAGLVAFDPHFVEYAQEARPYCAITTTGSCADLLFSD